MQVKAESNFSFAANTTYGCGGHAEEAYFPETAEQAVYVFDQMLRRGERFAILGNGSNVLAQDGLYKGRVIVTKGLKGIKFLDSGNLYCESGVTVSHLMGVCKEYGIGGLEYLSGIPATLGGICFMNAGVSGKYISENIVSVTIYNGKIEILDRKECNFAYKTSTMRGINCIILGCELQVERSNPANVSNKCAYYLHKRKKLPKGKSCGCVFKNPYGKSAGEIIEAAGLKGYKIGSAVVSGEHANFIINYGACSEDVYDLILYIKKMVYSKFAIQLEEEVCFIGDFK